MRRSGRQSGRDSSPLHSGPTVTASGRQVRSRATGTYGETLHSGQTTDRASPTTGDYVRSDVSEEPRQGRSTRAGNRSQSNREMDSEEDDDATSWDGGDEEDDEPEQMDLDDDDDDLADQSSEGEVEPQSLVVTLRYGKKQANGSSETNPDLVSMNGAAQQNDVHMADASASVRPAAPVAAPLAPTAPAPSLPQVIPTAVQNGLSAAQQPPIVAVPKVELQQPQPMHPPTDASALPKLDGFFSAPTPPYTAPEEVVKQEQPQYHQAQHQAQQQAPQQPPYPAATVPAPAPHWQ